MTEEQKLVEEAPIEVPADDLRSMKERAMANASAAAASAAAFVFGRMFDAVADALPKDAVALVGTECGAAYAAMAAIKLVDKTTERLAAIKRECQNVIYANHLPQPAANLGKSIDELEISVRVCNALKLANINWVYELVRMSEVKLLRLPNLGIASIREIRQALADMGLAACAHTGCGVMGHLDADYECQRLHSKPAPQSRLRPISAPQQCGRFR
jgi:hypothetical protein